MLDKSNEMGRMCMCLIILCCTHNRLFGEHSGATTLVSSATVRATHIMGFEHTAKNANGIFSFQDHALQFKEGNRSPIAIAIDSIRSFAAGQQDKQVGGTPMALTKAAAPFGGGRVISLFSHKKYDTVTLEYVDSDGGAHGAIFLLNTGQGAVLRSELERNGLPVDRFDHQLTKAGTKEGK